MTKNSPVLEAGSPSSRADGRVLTLEIPNVERMPPFLMTVLSSTDLWMFVTSNGGLTAGRESSDQSLFPYETVDRLYDRPGLGGPITLIRVGDTVWWPFDPNSADPAIERWLTKSDLGDRVGFQEVHSGLGLGVRYEWAPSETFGWIRTVTAWSHRSDAVTLEVLDGLLDILPAGVQLTTQQRASNLVDAYRHTELHQSPGDLAIYGMSSLLTDRAEPAEALRGNVVWRVGLPGRTHLSRDAIQHWRRQQTLPPSHHLRGKKGAYLVEATVDLAPGRAATWSMVADVSLDGPRLAELRRQLEQPGIDDRLMASIEETRMGLECLSASVDGRQRTDDLRVSNNHLSNALFNGLRGGFFLYDGRIPSNELLEFIRLRNRSVAEHNLAWIQSQPDLADISALRSAAAGAGDPGLARLVDEVLPLAYGRRHGDPSRPWNRFSIRTKTPDGRQAIHYEGNWRDIFQNWEALAISYPDFLPSMIAKFVNAETVDGFNPYRISREGIDWEVPDPEDPWSNIGYWNDHQIIYVLRLLEALQRYRPDLLEEMLDARRFSFADVPYRICPYVEMLKNPRDTIRFDSAHEEEIQRRVADVGEDGRLVWRGPEVVHTHLWEKLLIPLLTKLSNLILDGGIWMNTQRPEWNDANNALPGYGLSVVTMAHTLRYTRFLRQLLGTRTAPINVAPIVRRWFECVAPVYAERAAASGPATPSERRHSMDRLGNAFSEYRAAAYEGWPAAVIPLESDEFGRFLDQAGAVVEQAFRDNQREDGLFHSYNTMRITEGEVHIDRLTMMLEGQVAALDAQVLTPSEAVRLLESMYASPIYRADQDSFLLYPDKILPDLEQRNYIRRDEAEAIATVRQWLNDNDPRIVQADVNGVVHFHPDLKNAEVLVEHLDALERDPNALAVSDHDRRALLALYEKTFNHAEFTGRSASMYGYEGLGCIYWHMVAKLLVAVQETYFRARALEANTTALADMYDRVRGGFGFNKSPADYGAFPSDAYSHTPGHSGAQQPGMTGQVKEQILTRFGELGVGIDQGRLRFEPSLLKKNELSSAAGEWPRIRVDGTSHSESLPARALGFTLAGVPVVYVMGEAGVPEAIEITGADESKAAVTGLVLDSETTRAIFGRTGAVRRIDVTLKPTRFR